MESFNQLKERFEKVHNLSHLLSICGWDQASMMPSGGNDARSKAMAELGSIVHEMSSSSEVKKLMTNVNQDELKGHDKAIFLEIKRSYEMANALPPELVKKKSLAGAKCEHAWREQRPANDWKGFEKNFNEVLELSKQEAQIRAEHTGLSPYDALIDKFEPGMNQEKIDKIFSDVKQWLPNLLQEVVSKQSKEDVLEPTGPFAIEKQKELGHKIMEMLGFDFNGGRLDISTHPFCGGVPEDVRLTTRYYENDFTQSLMGIIHETGHACYEQNLPRDLIMYPAGSARTMGLHEGQSLLYEMQLGRSRSFLKSIAPLLKESFGDQEAFELDNLSKLYTRVKPGYIRVDADEVTYPLHVILRYEIEKELIENGAKASDIPDLWNEKMKNYLGLETSGNFKDGPLQDIHWTDGSFGYFPSYTLGAMYAAQQFSAIERVNPNLDSEIEAGNFKNIFSWLKENIWSKGSTAHIDEIIKEATGEVLNPQYLKDHLMKRYL